MSDKTTALIQRMYDEAAQCDVFGITKPAALLREAADALQHAANTEAMEEFAEVVTAGHLQEDDRQLAARIVQALPEPPPTPFRGWSRYKNECENFVDRLRKELKA